jgi:thiol-disulfide isomerase/thioredoxin
MKIVPLSLLRLLCAATAGLALCVTAWAGPDVGEQAKLKTVLVGGQKLSLDQLKGKVVMVNFWATWCGVCKAEMPGWQKFYEANKDKGFELIAMSIDEDQAELKKHAAKNPGYTFPVAWRWDDATDDNFGDIIGTPTLYVLDKAGKVAWTKRGRVTAEQLAAVVEPLLKQP